jgi:uncharacterized protein YciI
VLAVARYAVQPDQAHRIAEVYPQHRVYLHAFAVGGELMLIGTLEEPLANGSMAVFRTREAAERFCREDPFVLEGIADPEVLDWDALEFV